LHCLALHNSDCHNSTLALASSLAGEKGIRARSRDELGKQPMHLAAAAASDALVSRIASWCDDDTSMLFGELDRQDDFGTTPLAIAAAKAQEDAVDSLLAPGAVAHSIDRCDKTPLHHACNAKSASQWFAPMTRRMSPLPRTSQACHRRIAMWYKTSVSNAWCLS